MQDTIVKELYQMTTVITEVERDALVEPLFTIGKEHGSKKG